MYDEQYKVQLLKFEVRTFNYIFHFYIFLTNDVKIDKTN